MIRCWLALLCLLVAPVWAEEPIPELGVVAQHPVEGMASGNLSGMAWCGDAFWAVSDREDEQVYRLDASEPVWRAEAEAFTVPPVPDSGLSWGMRVRAKVSGIARGGQMDYEGLSCDSLGNRYLASESLALVLKVSPAGTAEWLELPDALVRQARASGMLLHFNAMFEGIAVDPEGDRLWLAAERERRGLMVLHRGAGRWQCTGGCVLLAESGLELPPVSLGKQALPRGFSGLSVFKNKLFTLETTAHRICRRNPSSGDVERCWSFAQAVLAEEHRYPTTFGTAEALWIDADNAWVGIDNNGMTRNDGEARPVVWRLAAPKGGWDAQP